MSEQAVLEREARRRAMLPGSPRDRFMKIARRAFPIASVVLLVVLVALPLTVRQEFSFLLSKDRAEKAIERLRLQEATYRGQTLRGEAFEIRAQSGVQKTSAVPIVVLTGLSAEIQQAAGPLTVTAPTGEFFIDENRIIVNGPVIVRSPSGYSLDGNRIEIDINESRVRSSEPVSGTLPIGSFRADGFTAEIDGRNVTLAGGVKLRITPNRTIA